MTNKITNRITLNSGRIYRPYKFRKKNKYSKNQDTYIKYISGHTHTRTHKYRTYKITHKSLSLILTWIIDCLKWALFKLMLKDRHFFVHYHDYNHYHEEGEERRELLISKIIIFFISDFLKRGVYEIWVSFPLLRTIDCGRVWKEAGYLESLRSATSIYSVRRTLMHTRARVQPHWSPCITGFYTLHWIFLSWTPSRVCAFLFSFSPPSYSLFLSLSLPPSLSLSLFSLFTLTPFSLHSCSCAERTCIAHTRATRVPLLPSPC